MTIPRAEEPPLLFCILLSIDYILRQVPSMGIPAVLEGMCEASQLFYHIPINLLGSSWRSHHGWKFVPGSMSHSPRFFKEQNSYLSKQMLMFGIILLCCNKFHLCVCIPLALILCQTKCKESSRKLAPQRTGGWKVCKLNFHMHPHWFHEYLVVAHVLLLSRAS